MKSLLINLFISFLIFGCSTTTESISTQSRNEKILEKARALTAIGNNLAKNNMLTQATEKYLKAIEVKPDFENAHYFLGRVLLQRSFTQKGIDSILKAIEINKNYTQARNFLSAFYFKQGLYKKALDQSLQASKDIIYENQEESLTQLALIYEKLSDKKQALLNMKRALATTPTNCRRRFEISKFFYKKGFVNTALKVARQADSVCINGSDRDALLYLKALIFYKSENYLASKEILRSISPKQNNLKFAIPKLLTKINSKTRL